MCPPRPTCQRFCLKFYGTSKRRGPLGDLQVTGCVPLKETVGTLCLPRLPSSLFSYALSVSVPHTLLSRVRSQHRMPKHQDCSPKPPTLKQVAPFLLRKLMVGYICHSNGRLITISSVSGVSS